MTQDEIEKLILSKIRTAFRAGRAAPTSKRLYGATKKKADPNAVDEALAALLKAGTIRITDGMWFEVGVSEKELEAAAARLQAARIESARKGRLKQRKVDNRKPSKVPRGMKRSAASRTVALPGVAE
jgi:hypothetical protein